MTSFKELIPFEHAISGTIRPPGSKSITNRALILSALSDGDSVLSGVLASTDTRVMIESLRQLGIAIEHDVQQATCRVHGCGGRISTPEADLWLENSGTSIRFLTALCSLGVGSYRLDGVTRMRERPIIDLVDCLNRLGGSANCENEATGCPPVKVSGQQSTLVGGMATIKSDISSQFLSAVLMSAPGAAEAVRLNIDGELVSKPYIEMTIRMMESFGATVSYPQDFSSFQIDPQEYVAQEYEIEPDASAASYFMGAAAVTGGSVTIEGLHKNALQGDVHFASALEQMGCDVVWNDKSIQVIGKSLRGIDIDMNAISDTAQTLATVAVFADSPTTIRSVGHMRHKETDRIAAVVTELQRAGIQADEFEDGLVIHPGKPQPAEIETYDDHRMAMSFSLLGLRAKGIRILDPECTSKTYPNYFEDLQQLCAQR